MDVYAEQTLKLVRRENSVSYPRHSNGKPVNGNPWLYTLYSPSFHKLIKTNLHILHVYSLYYQIKI
jgi:hypothetical protein